MKALVQRIYTNPKHQKIFHWGKLVSITGSAQAIVQVIGFVCGIIIIRLLPTQEYALYTLANTVLGTIVLLSDGGIGSGVMIQGGQVWKDRHKLGVVLVTGLKLRKKFAGFSLLLSLPVLCYLLWMHGAGLSNCIIILLSLIPAFLASLFDTILEIPLKLHQAIIPLQKNQIATNIGRLVLTALTVFIFPFSFIALFAAGLPRIYANYSLYKKSNQYADLINEPDPIISKEIISVVKRVLPGAIYYSISGQMTIWLISLFSTTTAIAQIGAIGRLTMLLTIFSTVFSTLVVPRFARLPSKKKLLLSRFLQIEVLLFLISAFIIGTIILFSNQFLSLLGGKYAGLNKEIIMVTTSGCIGMIGGLTYSVSIARGWILTPAINIGGSITTQVILILILNLNNIENVLLFSIINAAVSFIMLFIYFIICANRLKEKNS